MRILAVDPGEKNLGIAISDPTESLARPLLVLEHKSYKEDAARIANIAGENQVKKIIIGQALNADGLPSFSGRKAARLAQALKKLVNVPVELWDESFSTNIARATQVEMDIPVRKRRGHLDSHAAAIILQSYLDAHLPGEKP